MLPAEVERALVRVLSKSAFQGAFGLMFEPQIRNGADRARRACTRIGAFHLSTVM
jgi:hypothetical protein